MSSIDPLFVGSGLVLGCSVALIVLAAWAQGAPVKALIGMTVLASALALVAWSVIGMGGLLAVVVAAAFLVVWFTMFVVVRRFGHRPAGPR